MCDVKFFIRYLVSHSTVDSEYAQLFRCIAYPLIFLKALSNIIFPLNSLCYVGFGSHVHRSMSRLRRSKKTLTCGKSKASDRPGDFIRRSLRSTEFVMCARYSDCNFRRSPRSAYKIADIWHVRYRRLNSPAFAKCARSRGFLRPLLGITSKANPSGWAISPHDFSKLPHRRV